MNIYQNPETKKFVVAQKWTGSKKLYKMLTDDTETDDYTIGQPDAYSMNIDIDSSNSRNLFITDDSDPLSLNTEKLQTVHIGDYLVFNPVKRTLKGKHQTLRCVPKAKFEATYELYHLVKPTPKNTYLIQRLYGTCSDVTMTCVSITGSHKQAVELKNYLNTLNRDDQYNILHVQPYSNINFRTINW